MPLFTRLLLLFATWLGTLFRFQALFANSFHADEALFASFARLIAVWRDPLLLAQPVDKPPLLFYVQALFYPLLGPVEWAVRLPNFIASLLLIPLTGLLAWRLFHNAAAAAFAGLLMAFLPLAIQFSATAFIDPLLSFWLVGALVLVLPKRDSSRRPAHPFAAGLLFGLALATKYQALLFLPLLLALALVVVWPGWAWRRAWVGLMAGLLPLGLWAAARSGGGDLVTRQWANIGGLRPAWSWELWPRLVAQAQLGQMAVGWPVVVLAGVVILGLATWRHAGWSRSTLMAGVGVLFTAAYVAVHWLWAVPVWDRYLLPILPLMAVLLGGGTAWLIGRLASGRWRWGVAVLLIAVVGAQLPVAAAARLGHYPLGGRPDADGGAAEIARLLADAPYGTVLYDHWYSWQWRYHMVDKRVYVSWFPHAEALLADLGVFAGGGGPRYIALPAAETARPIVRRLAEAGYGLVRLNDGAAAAITLYRIELQGAP